MIRIVSDTTTGLSRRSLDKYNIQQAALIVHFGEETFRAGVDITPAQFFTKLENTSELPKTSAPPTGEFVSIYQSILDETPDATILSIHPSAEVSGSLRSAIPAAEQFPGADIRVFDTRVISTPFGLIVQEAGRMVADGASVDDMMAFLEHTRENTHVYFVVDTLEYLAKGGRIGKASHLLGTLLDIKPILKMKDGFITSHSKARTRKKSLLAIRDIILKEAGKLDRIHLGIAHAVCDDEISSIWAQMVDKLEPEKTLYGEITPAVGVHAGTGTVAIAWIEPL